LRFALLDPSRRGFFAQIFSLFTILAIQIMQVPIFIGVLGTAQYGAYLVLIALPSALTLSDFGLLSATSTRLMTLVSTGRDDEARRLSRFTNSVVVYITTFLLIASVVVILSVDISSSEIKLSDARMIVLQFALYAVFSVYSSSSEGSMRAAGRYANAWVRLSVMRLVDFFAGVTLLMLSGDAVLIVTGMLVSRMFGLILLRGKTRRVAPWASWKLVLPKREMAPGLLKPTLGSLALPVGNAFVNQGALLAVGTVLGPSAVVVFSTVRTMVNCLRQLTSVMTNASLPAITQAFAKGAQDEIRERLRRATIGVGAVAVFASGSLALLGPWIVSIWTSGAVTATPTMVALFCLQSLVESMWLVLSLRFLAQNRHFGYSLVFLSTSVLFVTSLLLFRPESLELVALVQIGSSSVVLLWIIFSIGLEGRRGLT
jgi:O-antigen/teichoic acid export membrane protein